jgi:streptogramin lyase
MHAGECGFSGGRRRRMIRLWSLFAMISVVLWLPARSTAAKFTIPNPEVVAATPGAELRGIGSDGANGAWFNEVALAPTGDEAYMVHYTPHTPDLTRINIHVTEPDIYQVFGVAPGLNGDEWFTRPYRAQVSRIAADGTLTDFDLAGDASPEGVVVDPSGDAWVTIRGGLTGQNLDRLSPDGELKEWKSGGNGDPLNLTIGPDGNLWVAGFTGGVTDVSTERDEAIGHYPVANPSGEYVEDVANLDGRAWATVGGNSPHIEALSPSGAVHNYALHNVQPQAITAGPDDAVWFTGYVSHSDKAVIGRLSSSGSLAKLTLGDGLEAADIAATSNAVYFTQDDAAHANADSALMRIPLQAAHVGEYVALGDSYSSGEGNPPYESGTDMPKVNMCHRSPASYVTHIAKDFDLKLTAFAACSGSVTADIFSPNTLNVSEPSQISRLTTHPHTTLVTITIGGDDAGFRHVLEECVTAAFHERFGCSKGHQLRSEIQSRLSALAGRGTSPPSAQHIYSIVSVLEAIHTEAPDAQIVIGGYPLLFGTSDTYYMDDPTAPSGRSCEVGTFLAFGLWIDYADAQWLNDEGEKLNHLIEKAALKVARKGVPVRYAEPVQFEQHRFCDSGTLWFHRLELEPTFNASDPTGSLDPAPSSFHPTADGQALGYAPAIEQQVK